jgi:SEFIR domain/AAA ATPase domain
MTESTQQKVPKVFISYSYDSEEHIDRVLELSDRLRDEGVDCNIDLYELSPPQGWYQWTIDEIGKADFVLMICTPQYIRRFETNEENGIGMGVTWEGSIITQELYAQAGRNSKYIPVLFTTINIGSVPKTLRSTSRYIIVDDSPRGYEFLYRRLTNQPLTPKQNLGKLRLLPTLPTRDRRQSFEASSETNNLRTKEPCNLSHKSYRDFIGREPEIVELLKRISPNYRQHINVVRGIGGVGKTALVTEVAHQCWEAKKTDSNNSNIPIFDAIIFTSSKATDLVGNQILDRPEKEPQLTDIFRVIADVLNEPTITQVLPEEQHRKVKEVLSKQSTLLIVDNMETLLEQERNIIMSFLNDVPPSTQVVITTREFLGFDSISIDSLTRKESSDLLNLQAKSKNIKARDINDKNWRQKIYNRFGGIPITLIYAVGKLAAGYKIDEIVNPKLTTIEDLGRFCFESSIEPIRNTQSYQLLMSMTFFCKSPCREALIKVAGLTDGNRFVIDALAKLQQLSLITEQKGRYNILPITLEYVNLELESDVNNEFKVSARQRWYDWYLQFTQQYGYLDWEGWRDRYDRIDAEWDNIQLVLNWYAEKAEWKRVLQLWQNLDNYADLSGYWQHRNYWWAILGKNYTSAEVRIKALSEKGFTLTLMGKEHYPKAEEYLGIAWELCHNDVDIFEQANVVNHLAILAKVREDYEYAHHWLNIEESLLKQSQKSELDREKKRYQIRNLYYRAEVLYLQNKLELAKNIFNQAINLSREVGWQRFRNYAKNMLADIYIKQEDLIAAEDLLKAGFSSATQARESRRIALYQATYARFYEKLAQQARDNNLLDDVRKYIIDAQDYASRALEVFNKEFMLSEKNEIVGLIENLKNQLEELNLTIEQEQNIPIAN